MGLILEKIVEDDCRIGVWEITEDFYTLISMLNLSHEEVETLNSFKSYDRKVEWLSVRTLLLQMVGPSIKIYYNGNRKPFLTDSSYHISISHSAKLTSVILSKTKRVGIDLEHMTQKISQLANKFLTWEEEVAIVGRGQRYRTYLYWCAKEALYKICDKKGINFKNHIIIDPFELDCEGLIYGTVRNENIDERFELSYFRYQDYSIVWCCKE
jgi:4'-phosphopantetheinyl transferase